jgi:hypothetical protein
MFYFLVMYTWQLPVSRIVKVKLNVAASPGVIVADVAFHSATAPSTMWLASTVTGKLRYLSLYMFRYVLCRLLRFHKL